MFYLRLVFIFMAFLYFCERILCICWSNAVEASALLVVLLAIDSRVAVCRWSTCV